MTVVSKAKSKKISRSTVALLYLGGRDLPFTSQRELERWCVGFLELFLVAAVQPILVSKKPNPGGIIHLLRAVRFIAREWNRYTGFVITLHRSRFLYAANLMSFMLGIVGKPVIFTTATSNDVEKLHDSQFVDTLLQSNIMNALQAATMNVRGTLVLAGAQMIPATHTIILRAKEKTDERFRSADNQVYGHVDFGIQVTKHALTRNDDRPTPQLHIEERIRYINVNATPEEELFHLIHDVSRDCTGVIIDGGESLRLSITQELPKKIPVLLVSTEGVHIYEDEKLISIPQLTRYAAAAKFTWVLGSIADRSRRDRKRKTVREWLNTDFIHEIIQKRP